MSNMQLIIISIIGWGIGSIFIKMANDNIHPIMVSAIMTAMYVVLIPVSFLVIKVNHSVNPNGVLYSLVGGLTMCIGSLAYFYALKNGNAGEVTAMTSLYPGLTLVLSIMFLGEGFSLKKGIGILLALASVYVLSRK
jgi:transporter family protein